jgi:hypothetical protein
MIPYRKTALPALFHCAPAALAQTAKNPAFDRLAIRNTPCNQDENVSTRQFAPVTARYLPLELIIPAQNGDPAARIYELEVHGDAAAGK